jgi:signal transduction histidine kinase
MQHEQTFAHMGQQINQIVSSSSVPEIVLQQIAQLLGGTFGVDCCTVTVASPEEDTNLFGCWYAQAATATIPLKLIQPLQQLAAMTSQANNLLVIDDINVVEAHSVLGWKIPRSAQAILQFSTWFQGQLNGIITLIRYKPYNWNELETTLATDVAPSVAIAISQVVQAQMLASLQQQVKRAVQTKALLNQLTTASRSSVELNQILQMAIAQTTQALEATRGLILTLKYTDPLFKTRIKTKIPKAKATVVCEYLQQEDSSVSDNPNQISSLLDRSIWISECSLCQQALLDSPNPIIFNGRNDLPATETGTISPLFNFVDLPSLLMIPLENQGTILGLIVLQHERDRRWHPEEISLVELVSTQISTTIIQNQTWREVQTYVDERTSQLQRSLDVQGKLYEKTRQQIDYLRQLNQLKDEFLSTMSHELRTPLTSMSLAIRMLRQPTINPERQAKYLDILEQQCTQEINLINDLLKLQQLESNQASLKLETIDIKPTIQDLAQSFTQAWADKGLDIKLELPKAALPVQTDAESFEHILQELLMNAGKYSEPDTTVALKVIHQVDSQVNQIILTLTNIGAGISPEDLDHIFDKFRRGQGVTQQAIQGTGLGLALVKCLVQQLNGTISATSSPMLNSSVYETCFTLTLDQFFASR